MHFQYYIEALFDSERLLAVAYGLRVLLGSVGLLLLGEAGQPVMAGPAARLTSANNHISSPPSHLSSIHVESHWFTNTAVPR